MSRPQTGLLDTLARCRDGFIQSGWWEYDELEEKCFFQQSPIWFEEDGRTNWFKMPKQESPFQEIIPHQDFDGYLLYMGYNIDHLILGKKMSVEDFPTKPKHTSDTDPLFNLYCPEDFLDVE